MLIALSSTFIVLSIILLVSFLWERKKCLRIQKRLFRESRKLDRTNHITSAILKNVHAYILLIDNDFKVLKTNYYQKTGTRKGLEEKTAARVSRVCMRGRRIRNFCPHSLRGARHKMAQIFPARDGSSARCARAVQKAENLKKLQGRTPQAIDFRSGNIV